MQTRWGEGEMPVRHPTPHRGIGLRSLGQVQRVFALETLVSAPTAPSQKGTNR